MSWEIAALAHEPGGRCGEPGRGRGREPWGMCGKDLFRVNGGGWGARSPPSEEEEALAARAKHDGLAGRAGARCGALAWARA